MHKKLIRKSSSEYIRIANRHFQYFSPMKVHILSYRNEWDGLIFRVSTQFMSLYIAWILLTGKDIL